MVDLVGSTCLCAKRWQRENHFLQILPPLKPFWQTIQEVWLTTFLKWLSKGVWLLSTLSLRLATNLEEGTYLDVLVPSWQVLPPHLQKRVGHVQVRIPVSWYSVLLSHHWEASFWEEALNWITHLYNCIFGHIKISPCNKERHFSYGLTGRKELEKVLLISRVRS